MNCDLPLQTDRSLRFLRSHRPTSRFGSEKSGNNAVQRKHAPTLQTCLHPLYNATVAAVFSANFVHSAIRVGSAAPTSFPLSKTLFQPLLNPETQADRLKPRSQSAHLAVKRTSTMVKRVSPLLGVNFNTSSATFVSTDAPTRPPMQLCRARFGEGRRNVELNEASESLGSTVQRVDRVRNRYREQVALVRERLAELQQIASLPDALLTGTTFIQSEAALAKIRSCFFTMGTLQSQYQLSTVLQRSTQQLRMLAETIGTGLLREHCKRGLDSQAAPFGFDPCRAHIRTAHITTTTDSIEPMSNVIPATTTATMSALTNVVGVFAQESRGERVSALCLDDDIGRGVEDGEVDIDGLQKQIEHISKTLIYIEQKRALQSVTSSSIVTDSITDSNTPANTSLLVEARSDQVLRDAYNYEEQLDILRTLLKDSVGLMSTLRQRHRHPPARLARAHRLLCEPDVHGAPFATQTYAASARQQQQRVLLERLHRERERSRELLGDNHDPVTGGLASANGENGGSVQLESLSTVPRRPRVVFSQTRRFREDVKSVIAPSLLLNPSLASVKPRLPAASFGITPCTVPRRRVYCLRRALLGVRVQSGYTTGRSSNDNTSSSIGNAPCSVRIRLPHQPLKSFNEARPTPGPGSYSTSAIATAQGRIHGSVAMQRMRQLRRHLTTRRHSTTTTSIGVKSMLDSRSNVNMAPPSAPSLQLQLHRLRARRADHQRQQASAELTLNQDSIPSQSPKAVRWQTAEKVEPPLQPLHALLPKHTATLLLPTLDATHVRKPSYSFRPLVNRRRRHNMYWWKGRFVADDRTMAVDTVSHREPFASVLARFKGLPPDERVLFANIDYASVLTIHKRRDGSGMRSYSDGDRDSDEDGNQLLLDADQPRSKIHGRGFATGYRRVVAVEVEANSVSSSVTVPDTLRGVSFIHGRGRDDLDMEMEDERVVCEPLDPRLRPRVGGAITANGDRFLDDSNIDDTTELLLDIDERWIRRRHPSAIFAPPSKPAPRIMTKETVASLSIADVHMTGVSMQRTTGREDSSVDTSSVVLLENSIPGTSTRGGAFSTSSMHPSDRDFGDDGRLLLNGEAGSGPSSHGNVSWALQTRRVMKHGNTAGGDAFCDANRPAGKPALPAWSLTQDIELDSGDGAQTRLEVNRDALDPATKVSRFPDQGRFDEFSELDEVYGDGVAIEAERARDFLRRHISTAVFSASAYKPYVAPQIPLPPSPPKPMPVAKLKPKIKPDMRSERQKEDDRWLKYDQDYDEQYGKDSPTATEATAAETTDFDLTDIAAMSNVVDQKPKRDRRVVVQTHRPSSDILVSGTASLLKKVRAAAAAAAKREALHLSSIAESPDQINLDPSFHQSSDAQTSTAATNQQNPLNSIISTALVKPLLRNSSSSLLASLAANMSGSVPLLSSRGTEALNSRSTLTAMLNNSMRTSSNA